ncbi:ATPase [Sphingomonas sp. ID0503]|uniref:F0F1 ATP synthase subunit B family protein n=1 Tax=Sphingomonas sp. ID0503 TaxID=3399691 RepID=UPI003AFB5AF4
MPQIAQIAATYASQIFWLLIVFGLIYFVIGRGMLPKIEATVEAREKRITDDLAAAERAQARARETEATYSQHMSEARAAAQKLTGEAKARGSAEGAAQVARADEGIAARTAEAEARLDEARKSALAGIEDVATDAALEIVTRLSGAGVDRAAVQRAVTAALAH